MGGPKFWDRNMIRPKTEAGVCGDSEYCREGMMMMMMMIMVMMMMMMMMMMMIMIIVLYIYIYYI